MSPRPAQPRALPTVTTINGRKVPRSGAKVSVFDNAVLYADGIFETFLAIGDRVVFLDEHLERLYQGAKILDLTMPVDAGKLAAWMTKTVRLHPARVKKLRLTITSGESARWVGKQGPPQVILSASPHEIPDQPFSLAASDLLVDHRSVFRTIKTLSYGINAAALKRAKARGCDDALLLNTDNHVAEITSANIFWCRSGTIYTPSLEAGCLEGVTREYVIGRADALGYRLREIAAPLPDLLMAEEVFLSSSLKLVLAVGTVVDGKKKHRFRTGPVTRALREDIFSRLSIDS